MNIRHKLFTVILILITVIFSVTALPIYVSAAPTKPVLKNDPMNGQILPFYEVWLRWYDVSNEHHYTMTIRDLGLNGTLGNSGPLIYDRQYVSQNATYFIVPTSKLTRGHHYRWCLNSVDANGNRTIADAHIFVIESHNPDKHFLTTNSGQIITHYTNVLEYFIYTDSSQYDSIIEQGVQAWSGVANVMFVRTNNPSDGHYELGIYDGTNINEPNVYGRTTTTLKTGTAIVDYSTVWTFKDNIYNSYQEGVENYIFINNYADYLKPNVMHEIGHVLLLGESWQNLDIRYTLQSTGKNLVPLIMNTKTQLSSSLNVVDRDHVRIKWGA